MKYAYLIILAILLCLLLLPIRWSIAEAPEQIDVKTYSIHKTLEVFGGGQWTYLNKIIDKESEWDNEAQNPSSTAFGLGQFLNSTWKTVGCKKTDDPYIQIDCMTKYIQNQYGTPKKAWQYHLREGHY